MESDHLYATSTYVDTRDPNWWESPQVSIDVMHQKPLFSGSSLAFSRRCQAYQMGRKALFT